MADPVPLLPYGPTVVQLSSYTEHATNQQYLVAVTEDGRIFYVRRELIVQAGPMAGSTPLEWKELQSLWPPQVPLVPRFISTIWVSTGNFLLGLKNDGSVWKCASPNANPLVWVQVFDEAS